MNESNGMEIQFNDGNKVKLLPGAMAAKAEALNMPLTLEIAKLAVALGKKKAGPGGGIVPDVPGAERLIRDSALVARRIERLKLPPPTIEEVKGWGYITQKEADAAVQNAVSDFDYYRPLYWSEAKRGTRPSADTKHVLACSILCNPDAKPDQWISVYEVKLESEEDWKNRRAAALRAGGSVSSMDADGSPDVDDLKPSLAKVGRWEVIRDETMFRRILRDALKSLIVSLEQHEDLSLHGFVRDRVWIFGPLPPGQIEEISNARIPDVTEVEISNKLRSDYISRRLFDTLVKIRKEPVRYRRPDGYNE